MKFTEIISKSAQILIIGHMRPDGDCFGAGLSLLHIADKLNKKADFVCDSDYSKQYSFMHGFERAGNLRFSNYDTVICVDCGDEKRLGKYIKQFSQAKITVNIDHHITNTNFAKENIVIPSASSTCEILGNIYLSEGLMDKTAAELIYVGLSADTGHFAHANTTKEVFKLATKLMDYDIDAFEIVKHLYRSLSYNKLRLIVRAIESMRFFLEQKICIISITAADLLELDCKLDDTEGLINYAINLESVEIAACICESAENSYKVSFRSKNIDVSHAAIKFGGGGHKHAAGCMIFGKYEDVVDKTTRALISELSV